MIKEAIGIASTIEEAKEKAMLELNASFDDEVQVEVLELPKKKTLGIFGGADAKVKISIEVPDPKPEKTKKKATTEKKAKELNQKDKTEEIKEENEIPADEVPADTPAGKGVRYLKAILDNLGCTEVKIGVVQTAGGFQINIDGEGLGVVIGHRGETLDALQYLVSLAANAGVGGYNRVVLNTGDFRKKREQTLISLAKRMSEQAIKSGKCRTLEPMNPYERRIIHTTVQGIDGVSSTSFGEGAGRRVVIAPEGKEPRPRNDFRGGARGRGGRQGFDRKREAYTPQVNPDKAPIKDADELPLYGRIDK